MMITGLQETNKIINREVRRLLIVSIFIILCSLLMESVTQSIYLFLLLILVDCLKNKGEIGKSGGTYKYNSTCV